MILFMKQFLNAQGQASDIEITAREIGKLKKELQDVMSTKVGICKTLGSA